MPRKKSKTPSKKSVSKKSGRRIFPKEFKEEAVQMLLDGHTASSVAKRLGLSNANVLYRWKSEQLAQSGPVASALEVRVHELEVELRRVERERDVLKKALADGCRKNGGRNE
jgi:transposase